MDPRKDAVVDPIPGPSTDPRYDKENDDTLGVSCLLWKEESFRDAEKTLNRGITTLLMNLATLLSNMDDLGNLADSMRIPRPVTTQLVSIYKPVMVTAVVDPIPGPSTDPRYDKENDDTLGVSCLLWKEESFHDAEKTLNRGITTLLMNLATLLSNMDDLGNLADSMRIPRPVTTQLVSIYKPVMVTVLQMYTLCSYHMLVVWYWSEIGDEFETLYNLQKIFDSMGLGSRCVDIMSCHGYGPIDTGLKGLLRPENLVKKGKHSPQMKGGLKRPNKLQENLETSPLDTCSSSGENGENTIDGEVSANNLNPGFKIEKNVSFEDSMVAGLQVKVLEKDIDGTIRRVNVTHSESE